MIHDRDGSLRPDAAPASETSPTESRRTDSRPTEIDAANRVDDPTSPPFPRRGRIADLPTVIPIGQVRRPRVLSTEQLGNIGSADRAAEELPARLYLADLDPTSFERTDEGWTVDYRHPSEDFHVRLRWDRSMATATVDQWAFGHWAGRSFSSSPRIFDAGRFAYHRWPAAWDDALARRLEGYNLLFRPLGEEPLFWGFPDGAFFTFLVPVPLVRFRRTVDFLREAQGDPRVGATVNAVLVLLDHALFYRETDNPDLSLHEPWRVFGSIWRLYGAPPLYPPTRERFGEERWVHVPALTYSLVIGTFFRDVLPVAELLERHRLLLPACHPDNAWDPMQLPEHGVYLRHGRVPETPIERSVLRREGDGEGRLRLQPERLEEHLLVYKDRKRPIEDTADDTLRTLDALTEQLLRTGGPRVPLPCPEPEVEETSAPVN